MKKIIPNAKYLIASLPVLIMSLSTFAQEKVEVNTQDVSSWFSANWMWVVGGIVLLILIILFSSGSSSRRQQRTTTIVKDDLGNTKRVVTTEVND